MALVEIAMFQNPIAAEVARGRLASEGIESMLFGAIGAPPLRLNENPKTFTAMNIPQSTRGIIMPTNAP
jgi:hypothetical protein